MRKVAEDRDYRLDQDNKAYERNQQLLQQEIFAKTMKRNELVGVKDFNREMDQQVSERMKQERQESIKKDPKPLKVKGKKYTHGKGWHREEDGRASAEDVLSTVDSNNQKQAVIGGGIMKNLFLR